MSVWYFDKKYIQNSPSFQVGLEPDVEARYRREGARFINNVGQKLGLRFDTCATGVTYFHRFYMFHSFKDFSRYVIGTACLFLAGKVEETPKKCRDLIKAAQSVLTESQFTAFGDDPKEEVMTMERILLQTIKFDLQVEHPYTYLLKYAKSFKGDKAKIQKVVQMAWTFINDSLCTTLCLQWEPEIIAIALIHLACRLTKFEILDWQSKLATHKGKWWDQFVENISVKLLEDLCHQVLDLYSQAQNKEVSSPSTGVPKELAGTRRPALADNNADGMPASPLAKQFKPSETGRSSAEAAQLPLGSLPATSMEAAAGAAALPPLTSAAVTHAQLLPGAVTVPYSGHYDPQQMYTASFLSSEGSQSLASLMGGQHMPYGTQPQLPAHLAQPFPSSPYPSTASFMPQQYFPLQAGAGSFATPPLPQLHVAGPHPGAAPGYAPYPGAAQPYPGVLPGYAFVGPTPADFQVAPLPPGALLPAEGHHHGGGHKRGGGGGGQHPRDGGRGAPHPHSESGGGGGGGGGGGSGSGKNKGQNKQNRTSSLVRLL